MASLDILRLPFSTSMLQDSKTKISIHGSCQESCYSETFLNTLLPVTIIFIFRVQQCVGQFILSSLAVQDFGLCSLLYSNCYAHLWCGNSPGKHCMFSVSLLVGFTSLPQDYTFAAVSTLSICLVEKEQNRRYPVWFIFNSCGCIRGTGEGAVLPAALFRA